MIDYIVAIDLQRIFFDLIPMDLSSKFYSNVRRTLADANRHNIRVIFIEYADSGRTIPNFSEEIKKENKIFCTKYENNAFSSKEFLGLVEKENLYDKNILFLGVDWNYCLSSTVKTAFEKGLNVSVSFDLMIGREPLKTISQSVYEKCNILKL